MDATIMQQWCPSVTFCLYSNNNSRSSNNKSMLPFKGFDRELLFHSSHDCLASRNWLLVDIANFILLLYTNIKLTKSVIILDKINKLKDNKFWLKLCYVIYFTYLPIINIFFKCFYSWYPRLGNCVTRQNVSIIHYYGLHSILN